MFEQLLYESQPNEEYFAAELTGYIYSNHLQSASLELDDQAEIISYEEIELARFANIKTTN